MELGNSQTLAQVAFDDSLQTLCEGQLEFRIKCSDDACKYKDWRTFYFVLKGNLLLYSSRKGEKSLGVLPIEDLSPADSTTQDGRFEFYLLGNQRDGADVSYQFCAPSKPETSRWVQVLHKCSYGCLAKKTTELRQRLAECEAEREKARAEEDQLRDQMVDRREIRRGRARSFQEMHEDFGMQIRERLEMTRTKRLMSMAE